MGACARVCFPKGNSEDEELGFSKRLNKEKVGKLKKQEP